MSIVTLLDVLVKGLIEAEEKFLENPKDFYSLEKAIKSTTEEFSAKYLYRSGKLNASGDCIR